MQLLHKIRVTLPNQDKILMW